MAELNYDELIKPYEDPTPPGTTKRTPGGQRIWLRRHGIPDQIIEEAMVAVYTELAAGRVFEGTEHHPAGYYLDRYLLQTAHEIMNGKLSSSLSLQNYEQVSAFSRVQFVKAVRKAYLIGGAGGLLLGVLLWQLIHWLL